jgi:hypothetical protein
MEMPLCNCTFDSLKMPFFPTDVPGLENALLVEQFQDQAQLSLQQQAIRRLPSLTRFGRILLFLPALRAIAEPRLMEALFVWPAFERKPVQKVLEGMLAANGNGSNGEKLINY